MSPFLAVTLAAVTFAAVTLAVKPAPAVESALVAAPQEASAKMHAWLTASDFRGSVLVTRGNAVVFRRAYGLSDREEGVPYSGDTVFPIGSITKPFTAAAILKLEMQGKLNVEDPIAKHLPGVPADKRAITLHHLLTHTAGLESDFAGDYDAVGRDAYVGRILAAPLRSAPGATWTWCSFFRRTTRPYAAGARAMRSFRAAHAVPRPEVSDEERERGVARMRGDLGKLEPFGIVSESEREVTIRAKSTRGPVPSLRFLFRQDGKLEGIGVELGD